MAAMMASIVSLFVGFFGGYVMWTIVKVSQQRWTKCICCGEQRRSFEPFFQILKNGKPVKGERYCPACHGQGYAHENNEINDHADDGEMGLRRREEYAAYAANGNTQAYWDDH